MMSDAKKPWQSKTVIASALSAVVPVVIPGAGEWISQNPEAYSGLLGLIFGILRFVTAGRLVLR
jgi:hypothetical protein